jgi:c(7)-type cytochrome triheme protein
MFSIRERCPFRDGFSRRAVLNSVITLLVATCYATAARAQAPATPPLRLPADAVYESRVGPDSAVVFRHGTHVALASNRCSACHSRLFRILTPTARISHAEMDSGQSCGACHDGRHAFSVTSKESCPLCHLGRARAARADAADGRAAAFHGPEPIRFPASAVSPGRVTFDHATHAKGECAECHPRLFPMKAATSSPPDGMHQTGACGACHDGKRAFAVEDQQSCARCHKEGAQ